MESSLHQQLKEHYADTGKTEVRLGDYRIDAIRDGELIEIQCASLSAIRKKCRVLLEKHKLRVVKPVVSRTRIAKCKRRGGKVSSRRLSPKRGSILEIFEEMMYLNGIFPHPNLLIEIPLVTIEERRVPRKKKTRWWQKDFQIEDVILESIDGIVELRDAEDLLTILQLPANLDRFDTAVLADTIDRPRWFAQQVAYVLKKTGAIHQIDRRKTGIIYQRSAA